MGPFWLLVFGLFFAFVGILLMIGIYVSIIIFGCFFDISYVQLSLGVSLHGHRRIGHVSDEVVY